MKMISRENIYILIRLFIFVHTVIGWSISPSNVLNTITKYTTCNFMECCNDDWIIKDLNKLQSELKKKVYGQHIVRDTVINALKDHLNHAAPQKALTFSFHGLPGSGKNYVTKFIVNSLFRKGFDSNFVHTFTGLIHFPLKENVSQYQEFLKKTIKEHLYKCPTQIFIFDEVDKIPAGVLNVITPMIDSIDNIDNVDYRKAIFIFLSNTGSSQIMNTMYSYWEGGAVRTSLQLHDFEHLIQLGAFNEEGGFQFSNTIESNLIDHYIPFLPLEKKHVLKCIEDEFVLRKVFDSTEEDKENVLKSVAFDKKYGVFATTGCKRIYQKVGLITSKRRSHSRTEL